MHNYKALHIGLQGGMLLQDISRNPEAEEIMIHLTTKVTNKDDAE